MMLFIDFFFHLISLLLVQEAGIHVKRLHSAEGAEILPRPAVVIVMVLGSHSYGAIKRYLLINYTLLYLIRCKLCFYFLYFRSILFLVFKLSQHII